MPRIRVGTEDSIQPGAPALVRHGGVEVGVFQVDGEFRAYLNRCPHQQGPVCTGPTTGTLAAARATGWKLAWVLDGRVLLCPWHTMEFDLLTGQRIRGRGERLRAYPVEVSGGEVFVTIGRPQVEPSQGRQCVG